MLVHHDFRRLGVARALLDTVDVAAQQRGCCKVTLEVLQGNQPAIDAYRQAGFAPYALDPKMGSAQFFEKKFYGD
jgi:ribosomal protein S18 acetylase RimI-like enzyme